MRKKFTIFLILIFILGLTPINFSIAITQNQIDAEVQIVCTDEADSWFSGSGTIIDPKGIILTNRHVIEGAYKNTCFIGFIESISQEPDFGTEGNYNLAEVKYYTTTSDMDAAILYLDNPTNKTYPYINIWDSNSDSLQFGDKVEAIGFPSIGGSTITYTSGDFSGFGSNSDGTQNYIKSTAQLEHGNSGGASYNSNGQFIGIPTMVVAGTLNSLSYILSVDSIKSWLSGILGNQYQEEIIKQTPAPVKPTVSIQPDVTPPNLKEFFLGFWGYDENDNEIAWRKISEYDMTARMDEWNKLRFYWYENCDSSQCVNDDSGIIKGYYYYFGNDATAIPQTSGKYISADNLLKKQEQKWFYDAQTTGKSGYFSATRVKIPDLLTINKEGKYYFKLQAVDINNNTSNTLINYEYIYETEDFKELKAIEIYDKNKNKIGEIIGYNVDIMEHISRGGRSWITIGTNQKKLYLKPDYGFPVDRVISFIKKGPDDCAANRCEGGIINADNLVEWNYYDGDIVFMKNYNLGRTTDFAVKHMVLAIDYNKNYPNKLLNGDNSKLKINFTTKERYEIDINFIKKLKGKILLQVEAHGEAYYVYPKDSKRYYMADGNEAYRIMRYLSVGITNNDIEKVKTNKYFAKQHSGKIFLQVEAHGEAYYIDFDGNAHYLKDGSAAYNIMRDLGLGITNNDLSKIPEGNL